MKKIVEIYLCDNCEKTLKKKSHLSIVFTDYSGWVKEIKEGELLRWKHISTIKGIKQFCNGRCLGEYFDKKIGKLGFNKLFYKGKEINKGRIC